MKDRAIPVFDLNCTIPYMFTYKLKTVPFWQASVPFKRTLTIVKFCDRIKMKKEKRSDQELISRYATNALDSSVFLQW